MTCTVGILGGMGPAAGADFARLFVAACTRHMESQGIAVCDQAYPEHWLAQLPIPDRTAALVPGAGDAHEAQRPEHAMLQALGRLAALGVRAAALACNTAHAWHGVLQERFPQVRVLHGMREVAASLADRGVHAVGLLATQGTYAADLYQRALDECGVACALPLPAEREHLMHGIYAGVKAGRPQLAGDCFRDVALALHQRHGVSTLVMGCTEIPLALPGLPGLEAMDLVDPSAVLAMALAREAYRT